VDNIRKKLAEVGWSDVDWIGLAQDRNMWRALVNSVYKLSNVLTTGGLSSSAQLHRVSISSIFTFVNWMTTLKLIR
jgi:hypothetical protein